MAYPIVMTRLGFNHIGEVANIFLDFLYAIKLFKIFCHSNNLPSK